MFSLPGVLRVAEADNRPGFEAELGALGRLGLLIRGQGPLELSKQHRIRRGDSLANSFNAVTGQRRPALDPWFLPVGIRAAQPQQYREPGGAFAERPDRRAVGFEEPVGG